MISGMQKEEIDPTANVIALVDAAMKRQDDLRDLESRHVEAVARLREDHHEKVRELESNRLDAILRASTVSRESEASGVQTAVRELANVTDRNAETLRNQVATTAAAQASTLAAMVAQINDRISALEKSAYEGAGKSKGLGLGWAILLGSVTLLGGLFGLVATAVTVFVALNR